MDELIAEATKGLNGQQREKINKWGK